MHTQDADGEGKVGTTTEDNKPRAEAVAAVPGPVQTTSSERRSRSLIQDRQRVTEQSEIPDKTRRQTGGCALSGIRRRAAAHRVSLP